VWERIGRLTRNETEVARLVEQCRSRVREREVRRLLSNITRYGEQNKFDEADGVVKEIFKLDPGNAEAVFWRDNLLKRRQDVVKKLYFDAKNLVFKGDFEVAEQNLARANAVNRDPDLRPKLLSLSAQAQARLELKDAARDSAAGDRAGALEHVHKAREHLSKAVGLPKTDPIFAEMEKYEKTTAASVKRATQMVLYWLLLAAASPGIAASLVGSAFFGGAGPAWGWGISALPVLAVGSLFFLWKPGDAKAGAVSRMVDDLAARQDDNGLVMKLALGVLGLAFVTVIVAGVIASLMHVAQPAAK
jgi:tetratricopeptide (TPR) repeat protein